MFVLNLPFHVCLSACNMCPGLHTHTHESSIAVGPAYIFHQQIILNHTRRHKNHADTHNATTQTDPSPSRGQPPITLLCQLPHKA